MINMSEQPVTGLIPEWTLGWRLQRALDFAGLTHAEVMNTFDVSRTTVSRWCRDVGAAPKDYVLKQIAFMCGVSFDWLKTGENPHQDGPDGGSTSRLTESNRRPFHYLSDASAEIIDLFPSEATAA